MGGQAMLVPVPADPCGKGTYAASEGLPLLVALQLALVCSACMLLSMALMRLVKWLRMSLGRQGPPLQMPLLMPEMPSLILVKKLANLSQMALTRPVISLWISSECLVLKVCVKYLAP